MELWKEQSLAFIKDQITSVRFDPHKDLVWVGDSQGRVASYFGPLLRPYTSFAAHYGPVKDIQISEKYIVTLGNDAVRSFKRNGLLVASNTQAIGDSLLLLDNNEFLVGFNRRVKRFTLDTQIKENGFFQLDSIPEKLRLTHMSLCTPNIVIGISNGTLQIVEPHTFDPILPKPITCHSGPVTDLDSRKNLVVSCGLSQRRYGLVPDVFVSCFDTLARRPLPPLSVSTGASFVRLHPKAPNHAIVVGSNGQLTFMDSKNPSNLFIKQVVLQTQVVGFDISPQGTSFIIADDNSIHYWSSNPLNQATADLYVGLEIPTSKTRLPTLGENTPMSLVGVPYYNQELLSNWNPNLTFETGSPTPNWEITKSSLIAQSHAKAMTHKNKNKRSSSVSVPRFLSEQARLRISPSEDTAAFADLMRADDSAAKGKVPKIWRQMIVHYSKFGVDDFDFSFYNSTEYAGLEPLSASRNCNAILQIYRWCPAIYNFTLKTFAAENWRELEIIGELAVVLDMLDQANGYHCRATNFMDTIQCEMSVTGFHDYLTKKLNEEFQQVGSKNPCPLSKTTRHLHVNSSQITPSPAWQFEPMENKSKPVSSFFVSIDEESYSRNLLGPRVHSRFWVDMDDQLITVNRKTHWEYRLLGYVAEINYEGDCHSVAVIKVNDVWHLFNDFMVTPITEHQALDFSPAWKRPCLLLYEYCGSSEEFTTRFDYSWRNNIDTRLLRERRITSGNLEDPGNPDALLKEGEDIPDMVALDAEFVLIRKELSEVHSDGSKNLVSPKKLSLARLSVLRKDESVLFDDMVESRQPVIDYVTAYSGIEPGDLDPENSKYGLVARKFATRKLWILLNSGTKFVGHALVNDFRTINLYVPPAQVVDTFDLYYDRDRNGMRRLSLKFLMWAVLDEQVQTGNHDSVQDALSALRLYHKYEKLVENNSLDEMLAEVAMKGQKFNYRVPTYLQNNVSGGSAYSAPTTPTRYL